MSKAIANWAATVTSGDEDAPAKVTALYAKESTFWPTVSKELRHEQDEILDYFEWFARLPGLKVRHTA